MNETRTDVLAAWALWVGNPQGVAGNHRGSSPAVHRLSPQISSQKLAPLDLPFFLKFKSDGGRKQERLPADLEHVWLGLDYMGVYLHSLQDATSLCHAHVTIQVTASGRSA